VAGRLGLLGWAHLLRSPPRLHRPHRSPSPRLATYSKRCRHAKGTGMRPRQVSFCLDGNSKTVPSWHTETEY
jgi:hypothetical protein